MEIRAQFKDRKGFEKALILKGENPPRHYRFALVPKIRAIMVDGAAPPETDTFEVANFELINAYVWSSKLMVAEYREI